MSSWSTQVILRGRIRARDLFLFSVFSVGILSCSFLPIPDLLSSASARFESLMATCLR
ncbi:hypothetical protein BDV11DRAFT_199292, partial [Aspergillus similis]